MSVRGRLFHTMIDREYRNSTLCRRQLRFLAISVQDCAQPHEDHGHGGRLVRTGTARLCTWRTVSGKPLYALRKASSPRSNGLSSILFVISAQRHTLRGHLSPYKKQLDYHALFVCESLRSSMIETSVFPCVTYFKICIAGQHKQLAWVHGTRDLFLKLAKHNDSGVPESQTVAAT